MFSMMRTSAELSDFSWLHGQLPYPPATVARLCL
jgi:hypothetical protein